MADTQTWTTPEVRTELPGPKSRELIERLDLVISGILREPEVPFVEASKSGWLINDVDGNRFADHHSSWGSAPLGADHPAVLEAVLEAQRRYGMECTDYVRSDVAVELAERLVEIAPPGITRVCHQITGTEAVEAGVKLARAATGRPMVLTFYGQYHGESTYLTAAGSTDLAEVPAGHAQYVAGLVFAPYPNPFRAPFHRGPGPYDDTIYLDYLEEHVLVHQVDPEQLAGVLIEPVLGEGGIIAPSPAFWQRLQQMCARWGWKLILDEVQTCMGRCGTMFAAERYDIRPDILLLGKALSGGGQPIAAVMATEEIMAETDLHLGGTYSWTPAAVAGALAGIDEILASGALDNALALERAALEELRPLVDRFEQVGDVRAAGALVGIEFVRDMASIAPAPNFHRRVHEEAVRRGVLGITQGGKWVYRLQPAINMPPELFRWSCQQVAAAIEAVAADPPPEPAKLIERDAPDVIEI